MDFPGIDKVENLHHHEGVEDECEVSGIHFSCLENWLVVITTCNSVESATAHSPSNH